MYFSLCITKRFVSKSWKHEWKWKITTTTSKTFYAVKVLPIQFPTTCNTVRPNDFRTNVLLILSWCLERPSIHHSRTRKADRRDADDAQIWWKLKYKKVMMKKNQKHKVSNKLPLDSCLIHACLELTCCPSPVSKACAQFPIAPQALKSTLAQWQCAICTLPILTGQQEMHEPDSHPYLSCAALTTFALVITCYYLDIYSQASVRTGEKPMLS